MKKDSNKVVVALIKNEDQKYLLIRPSDYKNFGEFQDAWYPPSGHVNEGEDVKDALIRELNEELNLQIKPVKLIAKHEQDIKGETAFWWECKIIGGKIRKSFEIKEFGWFGLDEIKNLKLWPATRKFFDEYGVLF